MSAVGVLAAVVLGVSVALLAAKIVRWRVWLLPRRALVVLALVAALATLQAQKGGGPMRSAPVPGGDATPAPVMEESVRVVTNLCCTAINVSSNEVELVYAWPEDYFAAGDILDLFASTNLAAPCEWTWCVDHSIAEGETNWTEQVDLADFAVGTNPPPAALFFKAVLRVVPDDLRDSDRDGLPDVYEFHNGTHPHVPDYESAPKRVVVDSVPSLAAALAASEPYSVIELVGRTDYDLSERSLAVPEWPVMVWCRDGYATIRSTGALVFVIDKTVNGDSLFKNLHLSLEASGGFQAGFWLGPGWVRNGTNSAAANFENVYIRMPNAGTEYFGWHYYRANENVSRFERCVVNATGSDWAHGIYSYDGPPMEVEGCTFMGFSSSGRNSFGVYLESSRDNVGGMSGETAVGIRNCVFDEGFANAHCYSFISSEKGTNYWVWMDNCLVPNGFVSGQDPDEQTAICHTNAELAAYGFPAEDSPVARMGLGALSVLSPSDVTDRDGDGLTDYAEAYVHGTDPWLRDSDYDGVDDFTELDIDHTDPLNVNSFVRRVAVTLTNRVVYAGVTNYVAFGNSAHGWETNGVVWSSTGAFASNCFDEVSLNGAGYARAYQDLNRNGVYDAVADILLVSPLPVKSLAKVAFSFGDVDGDGVPDKEELDDGSNPYDPKTFKINATFRYTDIDSGRGITNLVMSPSDTTIWDSSKIVRALVNDVFNAWANVVTTNGFVYVLCLHDKDGDREYDPGTEELTITRLTQHTYKDDVNVEIGDYDDDGIGDGEEELVGTDPYDAKNFKLKFRLDVSNCDCNCGVTNYVTISESSDEWVPSAVVTSFVGYAAVFVHEQIVTNGALYVKCMRDFDGDGAYTPGCDLSYGTKLTYLNNGERIAFVVGDSDRDQIVDSRELIEGTDPKNSKSFCFNLSATVTGIVAASNGCLAAVAYFGGETNVVYGPSVVEGSHLTVDFGHRSTAGGEKPRFRFWEDLNANGVCDPGERKTELELPVVGHDMCVTNMMPLGDFDADKDGMSDDWEVTFGLDPHNANDAKGDLDGDGFVNLHEYWAGTCPTNAAENGAGTALYAACHAVDDRIGLVTGTTGDAEKLFLDYTEGDPVNTNLTRCIACWINDIDISCSSIRNDSSYHYGDCVTLITPQHVIGATHVSPTWLDRGYYFRASDGTVFHRKAIAAARIGSSDMFVALLESPLPDSCSPAKLLPPDYESFIGIGSLVPLCWQNQDKIVSVQELWTMSKDLDDRYVYCRKGTVGDRPVFHIGARGHDSGNPCFMLFGSERVLLFCAHHRQPAYANAPDGPNLALYAGEIQNAIDTLSGDKGMNRYRLNYIDFSAYQKLKYGTNNTNE